MASMRLNQRLLDLAGVAEKNARLKAYEEARQAINAKQVRQKPDSDTVIDNAKEKALRDRFMRALQIGKATTSPDGEVWTLFAEGKGFAGTPDMELGEVEVERPEFEANMEAVRKLLGKTSVDPNEALLLMARAKDKFGSIDPMKLKQVLRYSNNDEDSLPLPAKGSR